MAVPIQLLAPARVVALLAAAAVSAPAATAAAASGQDVGVSQASRATAVAAALATVGGGSCFAGCPTIAVSTPAAVAVGFNVAVIVQVLSQSLGAGFRT